jgi:tetratricopeptide (TPR) repeat protein
MNFKNRCIGLVALLPPTLLWPSFPVPASPRPVAVVQNAPQLQKAIELYKEGEYFQAVAPLLELVKQDERNAEALRYLGMCYAKLNNPEEAIKTLRRALKISPENAATHTALSTTYLDLGDIRESLKSAEAAVKAAPANPEALLALVTARIRNGDFKEANETATKLYRVTPNDDKNLRILIETAYLNYGQLYLAFSQKNEKPSPDQRRQASAERLAVVSTALEAIEKFRPAGPPPKGLAEETANLRDFVAFEKLEAGITAAIAGTEKKPKLVTIPKPQMPQEAEEMGAMAKVRVLNLISENGTVLFTIPLDLIPFGLTDEAMRVAKAGRFEPATREGKPVRCLARIEVVFKP